MAASVVQTQGTSQGYLLDLSPPPPAYLALYNSSGWRYAASLLQRMLLFNAPPGANAAAAAATGNPDDEGGPSCHGIGAQTFLTGDCFMTMEWDAALPMATNMPSLRDTLRVAPLPGSRFVMPRRGAGGQAPTLSQDGVPEGLAPCTAELCSLSVNHDLLYLQPDVLGAEAAAAAASDGPAEARPRGLGSVLPTFAAREAAAVARLQRNPGHAQLDMPLVNRAPYSVVLDIDVSLRLQGTAVDASSLGDVMVLVTALRLGIDGFRGSRQNGSDALRRAATGFVMDSVREQMDLCDGYARGDWWRILAPSSGNSSRSGVSGSPAADSSSAQLPPHWVDRARSFATALRTSNAGILVSYYRSLWHTIHTPNAAPSTRAATAVSWLRYSLSQAARLLLPPNNTMIAFETDRARLLLPPVTASAIDAAASLMVHVMSMATHNFGDDVVRKLAEDTIAADEWHAPDGDPPSGLEAGEKGAIAAAVATFGCLIVVMVFLVVLGVRRARLRRHRDLWGNVLAPRAGPDTTLLVTDVQNSTVLWESIDVATIDVVLKLHHGTIRSIMLKYDGYESATEGDSFVIAFATPAAALGFATSCQVALLRLDWPARLLDHPDGAPVLVYSPPDPDTARDGRAHTAMDTLGFATSSVASSQRLSDHNFQPRRNTKWRLGGVSVGCLHADKAAGPTPAPTAPTTSTSPTLQMESSKASFVSGARWQMLSAEPAVSHHGGAALRNPAAAPSPHRAHRIRVHELMDEDECRRPNTHTGMVTCNARSTSAFSAGGGHGGGSGDDATCGLAGSISTRRRRAGTASGLQGAEGSAVDNGLQQMEDALDDGRQCTWREALAAAFPLVLSNTAEGRRLLALMGALGEDDDSDGDGDSRSGGLRSTEGGLGGAVQAGQASGVDAADGMARLSRQHGSLSRLWSPGGTAPVLRLADGRIALLAYRGLRVRMGMHSGLQDAECMVFNKVSSSYDYKGPFSEMARMVNDAAPGGLIAMSRATFARLRNTHRSTVAAAGGARGGGGEAVLDGGRMPGTAMHKRALSTLGRDNKHTSDGAVLYGAVVVYAGTHVLAEGGPHPAAPRALSMLPRLRAPSIAVTLAGPGEDRSVRASSVAGGGGSISFKLTLATGDGGDGNSIAAQRSPGPVEEAALPQAPSRGTTAATPASGGGGDNAVAATGNSGMPDVGFGSSILPLVHYLAKAANGRGRGAGGGGRANENAGHRGGASGVSVARAPAEAAPAARGDHIHNLFLAVHPSLVCRFALSPPLRVVRTRTLGSLSAPVRRVCVAFMKMVGASSLLADLPGPAARAMEQYQRIAARTLGVAGGYLVEGADGVVLAVFGSPTAAVGWSLDCMAALRRHTWEDALLSHELCMEEVGVVSAGGASGPSSPSALAQHHSLRCQASALPEGPRIKCGLDIGTCTHTLTEASGRLSYRGRAMNRASRIAGICSAGQVVVSGDVWRACIQEDEGLQERFTGASLGPVTLKGVTLPVDVVHVTQADCTCTLEW